MCLALLVVAVQLVPGVARGQHHDPSGAVPHDTALAALVAAVTHQQPRYADRASAIAAGYRRLGPDFPGMGEHWLHPGALLDGTLDPARPTLLAYAVVDGRPALLGVGFVITTRGAERPNVPGWPWAWHEHSGLLADESGASPAAQGHAPRAARPTDDTHVWVLHAWTGLQNPDGTHAPDNWALPFARLGLAPPPGGGAEAARAASLAVGGDAYLRAVLTDAGLRDARRAAAVDAVLATARANAAVALGSARAAGHVGPAEVAALRAAWSTLDTALRAVVGPEVAAILAPAHTVPAQQGGRH